MRRNIIILLSLWAFALLPLAGAQTTTVHGKLAGFDPAHSSLFVNEVVGNQLVPRDTIVPNAKGEFEMVFKMEKPAMYILHFDVEHSNEIHLQLLPKEKIRLELELWKEYPFVRVNNIKGSKNMTTYMQFNHALSDSLARMKAIDNEFSLASTTETRKQELSKAFATLQGQQNQRIKDSISPNTDCLVTAFLVTYFERDFATYADLYEAVRNGLKANYADNVFVQHVEAKVASSLAPNSLAPEIAMKNPQRKELKLSNLRGNIVLVDFWASWCSPCRHENPNVVKLYKKYHTAGFEVFSVSLDKNRDEWLKAIATDGLEWTNHVSDLQGWTSSGGAAYNVMSVPTTVLIDRQGRIIAKNLRGDDLARKLQELFGF